MILTLPQLSFSYNALEPYVSRTQHLINWDFANQNLGRSNDQAKEVTSAA